MDAGHPDPPRAERQRFLQSLSVLSVPTVRPEAFGLYALEAWATGVPVVLPDHGAFGELVGESGPRTRGGGGLLFEPNDPAALAAALETLLLDPDRARELGRRGRQAVISHFNAERMAGDIAEVCRTAARRFRP